MIAFPKLAMSSFNISGNVNFAPSSDPEQAGAISFAGRAEIKDLLFTTECPMTLQGSTIEVHTGTKKELKFTLSGQMTRASAAPQFALGLQHWL